MIGRLRNLKVGFLIMVKKNKEMFLIQTRYQRLSQKTVAKHAISHTNVC